MGCNCCWRPLRKKKIFGPGKTKLLLWCFLLITVNLSLNIFMFFSKFHHDYAHKYLNSRLEDEDHAYKAINFVNLLQPARQMEANASTKDRTKLGDDPAKWGVHGVNDLVLASHPPLPAMVVWGLPKAPHQTQTLLHPSHHAPDQEFNQTTEASLHDMDQNEIPSSLSYDDRSSGSNYNNSPALAPSTSLMIAMGAARDHSIQHCQPASVRRVTCNVSGHDERLTTMFSNENPHACSVS